MATKVHHQPEFVGANQLLLLLDFLRRADHYDAKFRELENMRLEVNKLIDAQVDLSKIDAMRAEATQDRTMAMKMRADANAAVEEMTRNAQAAANELVAEAERRASSLTDEAQSKAMELIRAEELELAKLVDQQAAAEELRSRSEAALKQALRDQESARAAEALANASRQKYEQKYAALQGALKASE